MENPYSLSSPANDDYLCAFDANDGELSKTSISVNNVNNLINNANNFLTGYFRYGSGNINESVYLGRACTWSIYNYYGEWAISFGVSYVNIGSSDRYVAFLEN